MERLERSGKALEDFGLAIQYWVNVGDTKAAQTIELAAACHAGDMRRIRETEGVRESALRDMAEQVRDIAQRILSGAERVPLVRIGQGDYQTDIHAEDLAWGRPSKLARIFGGVR